MDERDARGAGGPGNTGLYSKIRADRRSPHCGIAFHAAPLSTMNRGTNRFRKVKRGGGKKIIKKKRKGLRTAKSTAHETDEVGRTVRKYCGSFQS